MNRSEQNPWLGRFALFTAFNTLLLLGLGGLVTSKGVGMAVPDWPTTYGENMFLFHWSKWNGGIFYEHTHRLLASWVGLLTVILAVWIYRAESRGWLRRLGWIALFLVCFQGLLGGLRVTLLKDQIGVFHAVAAHSFFALLCVMALTLSPWWQKLRPSWKAEGLGRVFAAGACAVLLQLVLGATMRHQHSGLAIPDFPSAYGKLWPKTDPESLHVINLAHADHTITAFQIHLHMVHRACALMALVVGFWVMNRAFSAGGPRSTLGRGAMVWLGLLLGQAFLGALTVWTGKHDIAATMHMVLGALCLAWVAGLAMMARRKFWLARHGHPPAGAVSKPTPPSSLIPAAH